jgi:Zn-dependent protease
MTAALYGEIVVFLVVAVAVHETGHYVAARALGFPAHLVFRRHGVGIAWGSDDRISTGRERATVALAGPAASLALVLAAVWTTPWLAAVSFELLFWNMIPFGPSDGKHALNALRNSGA